MLLYSLHLAGISSSHISSCAFRHYIVFCHKSTHSSTLSLLLASIEIENCEQQQQQQHRIMFFKCDQQIWRTNTWVFACVCPLIVGAHVANALPHAHDNDTHAYITRTHFDTKSFASVFVIFPTSNIVSDAQTQHTDKLKHYYVLPYLEYSINVKNIQK